MSLSSSLKGTSHSYKENYFSIEDILATQEKIPCKFDVQVYNLGFLDPGSESRHIPPGAKMELPFWLARPLANRRKQTVSVEVPKPYREGYREILNADASVVDLHKLGPYYYVFGSQILNLNYVESLDIARSLLQTFQMRLRKIMDSSQNSYNIDTTEMTCKLDEMERQIFKCGQLGLSDFQRWETRATDKLTTSHMVVNHRKRKRTQMEAQT